MSAEFVDKAYLLKQARKILESNSQPRGLDYLTSPTKRREEPISITTSGLRLCVY